MELLAQLLRQNGPIDHWQTLIAGLIAIAAACIGGAFINRQISAAKSIEEEKRRRKHDAALATLPLTLSSLSEYARRCNASLKLVLSTAVNGAIPKQLNPAAPPEFPGSVVEDLREMVEFSDQPFRSTLTQLLIHLQIQRARLSSLSTELLAGHDDDHLVTVLNVEDYVIDAAETYARCAALFSFARGENDQIPGGPSRGDMHSALNQTGFWYEHFAEIHQRIDQRYDF